MNASGTLPTGQEPPAGQGRTVLHERARTTVYLEHTPEGPRVLKVLNDPQPTAEELARFHRDLEITRELRLAGVRRGLRTDRSGGRHTLILEYAPGEPLQPCVVRSAPELEQFLTVALCVANLLAEVHGRRVVHRDVKPANLIHDCTTGTVTLIDFGIAAHLAAGARNPEDGSAIEGTLAYLAPEQTGRTNRVVDARADLYSLGATFYELLAGRPPFPLEDAGELVHAHLALLPERLDRVNPFVPPPLADLVAKLLAKDAGDRYQSARGLAHDLERCLAALRRDGGIVPFPLGRHDAAGRLHLSPGLYGREEELQQLAAAAQRAGAGAVELVLLAGESGVGKSAVVEHLHPDISRQGAVLVGGKFDALQRSTPYSALEQAFRQWVEGLLTEPEPVLDEWRRTLGEALDGLAAALRPLIPTLDQVLGPLPPLPVTGGGEVRDRFRLAVRAFARVACSPERPLVLFVDDLQWADLGSLDVLRWMLEDPEGKHLLVIGAFRTDEVPSGHPLHPFLHAVRTTRRPVHELRVQPLAVGDVGHLLADSLALPPAETAPLAALVHTKTGGNPFFIHRFVNMLAEQGYLWFEHQLPGWQWNAEQIGALTVTDNVVPLLTSELRRLPAETLAAVQVAACIGGRIPLSTLAAGMGLEADQLRQRLAPAVAAGLLAPLGTGKGGPAADGLYGFVHDRVRQAAYDLLTDPVAVHLRLGRSLALHPTGDADTAPLLAVVDHLNRAATLIQDPVERRALAERNLAAGRRAAASAAYDAARQYFATGLALLPADGWTAEYDLRLQLGSDLAESSYLAGETETAEQAIQELIGHARTPLDAFRARDTRVLIAYARDRQDLVLQHGLEALRELGVRFPAAPNTATVVADLARTKLALRGRTIESLADLPAMQDARMVAAMQMVERMVPAAFRTGSALFPLLVFRLVRLSLRHGNSPVSAFGYSSYAISLCGVLGDYEGGYRFAQVGQQVAERFESAAFRAKSLFVFGNFVCHWKEPLAQCLEPLSQSWRLGMESGALFEAVWATFYQLLWLLQTGRDLADLEDRIASMEGLLAQDAAAAAAGKLLRQVVANLTAPRPDEAAGSREHRLAGPHYDEAAMQERHAVATDQTHLCFYHATKLQLCVWFGATDEALHHAAEAEKRLEAVTAMPYIPIIRFHAALATLDAYRAHPERRSLRRRAAKRARMLRRWARRSPANYRHKHLLLVAELARARGRAGEARERYDAAIAAARQSGMVHEEALVLERAGEFYHDLGQDLIAGALFNEAARAWRHWGAHAKAAQLKDRHPTLVASFLDLAAGGVAAAGLAGHTTTAATSRGMLDLAAVMKATGAISGVRERLLERLIGVAVESAGANRGALIAVQEANLELAGFHVASSTGGLPEPDPDSADAPATLCYPAVRLAARTQQPLVVDDARTDPRFRIHPRIMDGPVRSLLCVPIVLRKQVSGVLYLENDTPASFTRDRVELLTVLAGEAAIALENARLFDTQLRLLEAQKRFVPHEFLRSLNRTDIAEVMLGDSIEKNMSVMFSDLRGFSSLIEGMTPAQSIQFVNTYLGMMEPGILRHGGFVDEYQGDGILALFENHPDDALRAALDMLAALEQMNRERRQTGGAALRMGIGINTGRLILGTIGGERHLKAAVIGDMVNLSARIESLTKTYQVPLLVGGELIAELLQPADFCLRPLDTVRVVGRSAPVTVYDVFDHDPPHQRDIKHQLAPRWAEALALYRNRHFAAAHAQLAEYRAQLPGDWPAALLAERCARYAAEPPPADWTPAETLQQK